MGHKELVAEPIVIGGVTREREVWHFEDYEANGGVLPRENFNRVTKLIDTLLPIPDEELFPRDCRLYWSKYEKLKSKEAKDEDMVFTPSGRLWALSMAEESGLIEKNQPVIEQELRRLVITYCILRRSATTLFGVTETKETRPGSLYEDGYNEDDIKESYAAQNLGWRALPGWSDRWVFAEALLVLGEIGAHRKFTDKFTNLSSPEEEGPTESMPLAA